MKGNREENLLYGITATIWFERGIIYMQDLLNHEGKFLSLQEFR